MKISEAQITKMMKSLDLTREEAIELIKDDMEIDKMSVKECTSDMTDEQKKAAKKATITTGEKKKTTSIKKERKKDNIKIEIISTIAQNLNRCYFDDDSNTVEDIAIIKPEREITFTINGEEYSITLTKHRKKD